MARETVNDAAYRIRSLLTEHRVYLAVGVALSPVLRVAHMNDDRFADPLRKLYLFGKYAALYLARRMVVEIIKAYLADGADPLVRGDRLKLRDIGGGDILRLVRMHAGKRIYLRRIRLRGGKRRRLAARRDVRGGEHHAPHIVIGGVREDLRETVGVILSIQMTMRINQKHHKFLSKQKIDHSPTIIQ